MSHLFDRNKEVKLILPTEDGDKSVVIRNFPSDEQIARRRRARKVLITDLGRGASENKGLDSNKIDTIIFNEIKTEGDLEPAEAAKVLELLTQAEPFGVEREGNAFRVTLKVPTGRTEHLVKIPSAKVVQDYRQSYTRLVNLPNNQRELILNAPVAGEMYDKLCIERSGYVNDDALTAVPLNHKDEVINQAIQALDREIRQEAEDPENF